MSLAVGTEPFMFATGIECSYPVITGRDGRPVRVDEMARTRHYERWREDFRIVRDLGIGYLRYGPPYYRVHRGPGEYDWDFADETFAALQAQETTPIADLCHFGVPDWVGGFQNPDWPPLFAEYAGAFAARYPWVRFYTPVNEMYVCANYSGLRGWWNERLTSDRGFVTALTNLVTANTLAQEAILRAQPHAHFIQSEWSGYYHPTTPEAQEAAERLNHRRYLSLDLCYGHEELSYRTYEYLLDNGLPREHFHWLLEHGRRLRSCHIMGTDYYVTNEHRVDRDGRVSPCGEMFGYYVITKQYFERYRLPVMHTETNVLDGDGAPAWLEKQWANALRIQQDGVPLVGFTWYSLQDQVDWDTGLREDNGRVNPVGLVDLDRKLRPVGEAYKQLIAQWREVIPPQTLRPSYVGPPGN
jgi:beta-glucosidase/6-phospho-beta-glucosidase/beta-galactosidase